MKKSLVSLLFVFQIFYLTPSFAATKYISIGTGSITGVYYPTGGAICRLVNRGRKEHGIRCATESTGGSVANLNAVRSGDIEIGIAQSDWQYHALMGTGFFADQEPDTSLRSIFSLYTETFAIAVTEESGIRKIDDLVGKIVNFGPRGSGMNATMEVLSAVKGWSKSDFEAITYLTPPEQPKALCEGKINAMIYIAGNPNGILQEATQYPDPSCKVRILNIDKKSINRLVKMHPFYVKATIPGGMYRNNPDEIETFGTKATLVTSSKVDDDVIYHITKAMFENFENFKSLHPVFASMTKEESIKEGNSAPVHKGAIRYYKEVDAWKK